MLSQLLVCVDEGPSGLLFSFGADPIHILTLAVTSASGDVVWKLVPASAQPCESSNAMFWNATISSLPSDKNDNNTKLDSELSLEIAPPLRQVIYGEVPQGYIATHPHRNLIDGTTYHVVVIAEEGHGGAEFAHVAFY